MAKPRRPILHKGEVYNDPVERKMGGNATPPAISYSVAKDRLLKHFDVISKQASSLPKDKRLPNELVICYRMDSGYTAKSYYPSSLLNIRSRRERNIQIEEIGSRIWRESEDDDDPKKLFFVRTTEEGLDYIAQQLNKNEDELSDNFKLDVRRMKSADLLKEEEQILGFPDDWEEGTVELILHPFRSDMPSLRTHFRSALKTAEVDLDSVRSKRYEDGMTFVSFVCKRKALSILAGYNPLRSIHPLEMRTIPNLRSAPSNSDAPVYPDYIKRPEVTIGVFDGGLSSAKNEYLDGFSENVDLVKTVMDEKSELHGTAVTGAVLYGPLNKYKKTDKLPHPLLYVKHFRVMPADDHDKNLYEIIDAIEKVVPGNRDIKIYNLSLGPTGPILDDQISRFTYALDKLQALYDVVFCTAVGNDGEYDPLGRIQAPADSVNGIGVGAHTIIDGEPKEIEYSCYGPGREGNKYKPDISAYGGCERNRMHLLDTNPGDRLLAYGTSLASPVAASLLAQIVGYSSSGIDTLTGRALLIHKSTRSDGDNGPEHHRRLGHGYIPESYEEVVDCEEYSYTLIYRGEVPSRKYVQVKIPWVPDIVRKGSVNFKWTLAINTPVQPLSPDDYTSSSIETIFYPNVYRYSFTKKNKRGVKKSKVLDIQRNEREVENLISDGWERSNFPVSASGIVPYSDEHLLRSEELKWDTVDCRSRNHRADNVKEPMFHLHALTRGRRRNEKVKYALVLTVTAPKAEADIYSRVLRNYTALAPIKMTIDAEIQVRAKS